MKKKGGKKIFSNKEIYSKKFENLYDNEEFSDFKIIIEGIIKTS
jgi:hypothetical protein